MKRQMIIGVIAGALLAFTGVAFGQGAPATAGTKAPAKESTHAKKEMKKEKTHKESKHKESKHYKKTMHKETKHKEATHKKTHHEKKKSKAPAAKTK